MTGGEFTGPALAAGTVLGVRAFDIDNLGRLRGVQHHGQRYSAVAHVALVGRIARYLNVLGLGVA